MPFTQGAATGLCAVGLSARVSGNLHVMCWGAARHGVVKKIEIVGCGVLSRFIRFYCFETYLRSRLKSCIFGGY